MNQDFRLKFVLIKIFLHLWFYYTGCVQLGGSE